MKKGLDESCSPSTHLAVQPLMSFTCPPSQLGYFAIVAREVRVVGRDAPGPCIVMRRYSRKVLVAREHLGQHPANAQLLTGQHWPMPVPVSILTISIAYYSKLTVQCTADQLEAVWMHVADPAVPYLYQHPPIKAWQILSFSVTAHHTTSPATAGYWQLQCELSTSLASYFKYRCVLNGKVPGHF